jgi:hypothetical protein
LFLGSNNKDAQNKKNKMIDDFKFFSEENYLTNALNCLEEDILKLNKNHSKIAVEYMKLTFLFINDIAELKL